MTPPILLFSEAVLFVTDGDFSVTSQWQRPRRWRRDTRRRSRLFDAMRKPAAQPSKRHVVAGPTRPSVATFRLEIADSTKIHLVCRVLTSIPNPEWALQC
jgi:hypothetical protein